MRLPKVFFVCVMVLPLIGGCSIGDEEFDVEAAISDPSPESSSVADCVPTEANGSTPPGEQPNDNFHGNGTLWTVLWSEGVVQAEPKNVQPDGQIGMKWHWWRGIEGSLTIEGKRLDASAPPLRAIVPQGYGESGFQASALYFPTTGCWEISGTVNGSSLTFITQVELQEGS